LLQQDQRRSASNLDQGWSWEDNVKHVDVYASHVGAILPLATIDTRVVPAHERIEYWEEQCSENVVGLRCSCLSETGLEARYRYFDFGRIKMIDIAAGEHFVERTPQLLRQFEKDSAFLTIILEGQVFVNRSGQCVVVESGDAVMYDTNKAYMYGFPSLARQVIFEIPGEEVRKRFGDWNLGELLHFSGAISPSKVVPKELGDVLRTAQTASWSQGNVGSMLEGRVWQVMETAYSLVKGGSRSAYHAQLLQRVRKYVIDNLGNPELNPAIVSEAMGIGLRQLNRLFAGEPLSLMAYIQIKRLEGARNDLLRHVSSHANISEISYKWGFKSQAHFSRRFRDTFGCSPSECK
jgi:AraC-like DNA-binding protein